MKIEASFGGRPESKKAGEEEHEPGRDLDAVMTRIVDHTRPFFEDCEYVVRPDGTGYDVKVHVSEDEKEKLMALLDLLNIIPWDDGEVVSIEGRYDVEKLILSGLVEEKEFGFTGDRTKDDFDPYAFPMVLGEVRSRVDSGPRASRKNDGSTDESSGVDTELQDIIERFDEGRSSEEEAGLSQEIGFLKRISKDYRWIGGKVFKVMKDGTSEEISKANCDEMIVSARDGNAEEMNEFLKMNVGLVHFVFRNFTRLFPSSDHDDLLQEGLLGLKRAVERYDPSKGAAFATYAVILIESAMRRAWRKERVIYLPEEVISGKRSDYHKAVRKVENASLRAAAETEIANELGVKSLNEFKAMYLIGEEYLDIDEIDEDTLAEFISTNETPESIAEREELKKHMREALDSLDARERLILGLRFSDDKYSLEQVGEMLGVTSSRVGQIEKKALRKLLGHPSHRETLKRHLE